MTFRTRRPLPKDWRRRLPEPSLYYAERLSDLGNAGRKGWASGKCPFHDDASASLSVQLVAKHGGWKCFAGCGSGDLIAFHMRLTGKTFSDALRDLIKR